MPHSRMTMKQQEALQLLVQGYTSKEIARIVGVSASAIDQRIDCAARAAGVENRRALARWYMETSGAFTPDPPQVALNGPAPASSISDQKDDRVKEDSAISGRPPEKLIVVPVPETWSTQSTMRQMLEAAFFVIMIALGLGALADKLT